MKNLILLCLCINVLHIGVNAQCETGGLEREAIGVIGNDHRVNNAFSYGMISYQSHADNYYYASPDEPLFYLGFGKSLWAAAKDMSGELMMSANTFPQLSQHDFIPGPLNSETGEPFNLPCQTFNRVWVIREIDVFVMRTLFDQDNLTIDDIATDILEWPARGNPHLGVAALDRDLAPFFDFNGDGTYDPLVGDYPLALEESPTFIPHQFSFLIYNDRSANLQTQGRSIGLEIMQTNFVVNCTEESPSEDGVFTRLTYNYLGLEPLSELKLAIWEDNDMACNQNDYTGCDLELNCSYFYNESGETWRDECHDPDVPDNNGAIRTSVFLNHSIKTFRHWFLFGVGNPIVPTIDPTGPQEFYNYMTGLWRDETPLSPGGSGYDPAATETTLFSFPNRPTDNDGWSMQTAGIEIPIDIRAVTLLVDETDVQPGATGHIDMVDHFLYDPTTKRLDVFEQWPEVVNNLKEEFEMMRNGEFSCGLGLELCLADCVWPGDVNRDATVDGKDIIAAGVLAGFDIDDGIARGLQSSDWFGFNSENWSISLGGVNAKNGDVNGSGRINEADLQDLTENFGNIRSGYVPIDRVLNESIDPQGLRVELEVDTVNLENATLFDRIVNTDVTLGDENNAISGSLHGLSFDMQFDTNLVVPFVKIDEIVSPLFNFAFGDMTNAIRVGNELLGNDNIQYGFTNLEGNEVTIGGPLANQNLFIKDNARTANPDGIDTLMIRFFNVCGVDSEGNSVDIGVITDTLIIMGLEFDPNVVSDTQDLEALGTTISIYPNPADNDLFVSISNPIEGVVRIIDMQGQRIHQQPINNQEQIRLDVGYLTSGLYILQVVDDSGKMATKKFVK